MGILGFTEDERKSLFRTVAGVLHFGNIQVKQRPREEWATIPNTTDAEKVCLQYTVHCTVLNDMHIVTGCTHSGYQLN